eukprot:CAMPEP_0172920290 /NCGR_PEP_ID=MMETSP1075-20121228/203789_1 /TAXON_ID=2916 /ORGANISM="Ceratium fusus, Strain PA161109" /LENGTH=269 /DNA_ID=CAMNT_0013780285 /DNA_START=162 /DNA_END=967 /DNA_ORIENTATION=-
MWARACTQRRLCHAPVGLSWPCWAATLNAKKLSKRCISWSKPVYAIQILKDDWGPRPFVEELPSLPATTAARIERLMTSFPHAYGHPQDTPSIEHANDYRQHFAPFKSNRSGGEFCLKSVARLFCSVDLGKDDTFVDVGSGLGKLVVLAVATTSVEAAWGIELSPLRAKKALHAAEKLLELGALSQNEHTRMQLLRGCCAEALPPSALAASHLLLALKVPRPRRNQSSPVDDLLLRLRSLPPASGRMRTLWSVGRKLPLVDGLVHVRTV